MPAAPATANQRNALVLAGVARFGTHFFELMYPTLAVSLAYQAGVPIERALGWSFLGYLLLGIGPLPAALLADRVGARVLLVAGMAGMGVAGLSASGVPGGTPLVICLGLAGLSGSVCHVAGLRLTARTLPSYERTLGAHGLCANLALAATPVVTARLCEALTWQGAYGMAGFAMCALAIACAFLPIAEPAAGEQRVAAAPARVNGDRRRFALLCAAAALGGLSYRGSMLILPAYVDQRVFALGFGATTSLVYLFAVAGQYLARRLAEQRDPRWLYLAFHGLSLPALLLMAAAEGMPLVGAAALFAFFSFGMRPIEDGLFARFAPPRWRSAGGIDFVLSYGIGALAVRFVGAMKPEAGLSTGLLSISAIVAVLVGVIAALVAAGGRAAVRDEARADALADAPPATFQPLGR